MGSLLIHFKTMIKALLIVICLASSSASSSCLLGDGDRGVELICPEYPGTGATLCCGHSVNRHCCTQDEFEKEKQANQMSFKLFYDTVVIKNRFKYEKTKQKIFRMKDGVKEPNSRYITGI